MRYGFNLKNEKYLKDIDGNDVYQFNLLKNKAMITGNGSVVRYFYQNVAPAITTGNLSQYILQDIRQSFFYQSGWDNAFVFFGITKMINSGIVRLLTSGGVSFKGTHEERLRGILDANEFETKWHEAVKQVSGIGDVIFRVANDKSISDRPIIEIIDAPRYELIIKRGVITGYVLKARAEVESVEYEMQEIYTKSEDGIVQIEYRILDDGKPLDLKSETNSTVPKVLDAFGITHLKRSVPTFPIQLIHGIRNIPIIYKANTEVNAGRRGIPDTDGMDSLESALSEVLSDMVDEVRKAGLKILIDQRLQPINDDGTHAKFDHFNKTIIVTKSEGVEGQKLIQSVQGNIMSEKYVSASSYLISIACNKAGIHPLTVGITGLESIVASAESQQEREGKTSLRKRSETLIEWGLALKRLGVILLEMDDLIRNVANVDRYDQNDVYVEFGKYTNPNPESIVSITQQKINAGIESMKQAIERENSKLSKKKIDTIYAQVKAEKQLPLTNYEQELLGVKPEEIAAEQKQPENTDETPPVNEDENNETA